MCDFYWTGSKKVWRNTETRMSIYRCRLARTHSHCCVCANTRGIVQAKQTGLADVLIRVAWHWRFCVWLVPFGQATTVVFVSSYLRYLEWVQVAGDHQSSGQIPSVQGRQVLSQVPWWSCWVKSHYDFLENKGRKGVCVCGGVTLLKHSACKQMCTFKELGYNLSFNQ